MKGLSFLALSKVVFIKKWVLFWLIDLSALKSFLKENESFISFNEL
jgi:hypothetical protein